VKDGRPGVVIFPPAKFCQGLPIFKSAVGGEKKIVIVGGMKTIFTTILQNAK